MLSLSKTFILDPAGFLASLSNSPWVGLSNFEFLFSSGAAFDITRNTILYNLGFITLNLFISISFAIIMSELRNKKLVKVYQTMSLFPLLSFLDCNFLLCLCIFGTRKNRYYQPTHYE